MKLFLIRHGQSLANAQKLTQGFLNTNLSLKGIEQSKTLAKVIKNKNIDAIYSSDLLRALKTAEEIIKFYPNLKIIESDKLREQNKGVYEGQPKEKVRAIFDSYENGWYNFNPEKGESFTNVWKRTLQAYNEIYSAHKNQSVILVGHGGPISCIITFLKGKNIEEVQSNTLKNGEILAIDIKENQKPEFEVLNY
jgi:broad specificity phosphatase PhoE